MAAHVPQDKLMLLRERLDLASPHLRGRGIAMTKKDDGAFAMRFVIDVHAVAREHGHASPPNIRPLRASKAILSGRNDLGNSSELEVGLLCCARPIQESLA